MSKNADVARSTCPSQNVQSASFSNHCWAIRCQKKIAARYLDWSIGARSIYLDKLDS